MISVFDEPFQEAALLVSEITQSFSCGVLPRDTLLSIFLRLDWDKQQAAVLLDGFTSDPDIDVQDFVYWLCGVSFNVPPALGKSQSQRITEEYCPEFPVDACPDEPPDLVRRRSNRAATAMQNNPNIFANLRSLQTPLGVSLARCMKPGMDCPDHPMIKSVGAVAGDAECYNVFREFFDPIIRSLHQTRDPTEGTRYPVGLDPSNLQVETIDSSGQYVLSCRMRFVRNLQSARFPPAILPDERKEVETTLRKALSQLPDSCAGQYFSLQNGDLGLEMEEALDNEGLLFDAPESGVDLSSGYGREWPEGRGVFVNSSRSVTAWVNNRNHLRLFATLPGGLVKNTFETLCTTEASIRKHLQQNGSDFAWSDRLGFLTSCPSQIGFAGFRVSFLLRLPYIGDTNDFTSTCRKLGLHAKVANVPDVDDTWLLTATGQFGVPETETINQAVASCQKLIQMDEELESSFVEDVEDNIQETNT